MPPCGRWMRPTLEQLKEEAAEIYAEALEFKLKEYPRPLRWLLKELYKIRKREEIEKIAEEALGYVPYSSTFLKYRVLDIAGLEGKERVQVAEMLY